MKRIIDAVKSFFELKWDIAVSGAVIGTIRKTWGVEAYRFHPVDGEPGEECSTFHECVSKILKGN